MRKTIIAGNWKMNKTFLEADDFFANLVENIEDKELFGVEIVVCPPSLYLELASDTAQESAIFMGAQNVSEHDSGAFTGEISAPMLSSMDLEFCIVGHSERRKYFGDTDELVNMKIQNLLKNNISPIVCLGESLAERENEQTKEVVLGQLEGAFHNIEMSEEIVIAYEPIWAIGTGKTASPQQAQEIHKLIRDWLSEKYSDEIAGKTHILYGGSMNPGNVENLLQQPDIDGGLIGGASLETGKFNDMIDVAIALRNN
ncbi:MAG: triose-phosphate isomerase [Candidatus Cloacimonetes bacterium]|mgnify:CR=1 FL=1|jgi:triosephosphate isomerase (TIM)|nr:triose-phosphate isomerase [Candidatus Cloacimonadota bacterium]MBT6994325.1 triose-phosphate isomerase [Candidatus Cloacimonadota bacterium]MBT7469086.1 triose-phosphate isomerase [Candidatus Cloacimonadota bacterium]